MQEKTKKVLNIVVNVIVGIVLALVLFVTVSVIASGNKGYTAFFGTTFVSVESDSMKGDGEDNFSKGDLIKVKILSDEEKENLKEGDIITFYDMIEGTRQLNTHRIKEVIQVGGVNTYVTKGDNNTSNDSTRRYQADIIGIYDGQIPVIGSVVSFFHSSTGFLVCVVVPSFLVVAYFAFNLFRTVKAGKADEMADEKERMRQELLQELQAQGKITASADDEKKEETKEETKEEEKKD